MKSIEVQLNEANARITALETENTQLKESVSTQRKATAKVERAWLLEKAGLPPVSVKRINEAFANSTDNAGLKQAINTERKQFAA
jgi:hypothetical protein